MSQELKFWGISSLYLETCCMKKYLDIQEVVEFKESWDSDRQEEDEDFTGRCGKYQRMLWDLFDKPHTCLAARMIALLSSLFIFTSVIILTLATLPTFSTEVSSQHSRLKLTGLARTGQIISRSPSSRPLQLSGSRWSSLSVFSPVQTRKGNRILTTSNIPSGVLDSSSN